jgi:ERCC4-related helicase
MQFRNHLESLKRLGAGEPKVEELSRVLREHFACDENKPRLGTSAGAVMVFTSMRNAVTDICSRLNGLEGTNIKARCAMT